MSVSAVPRPSAGNGSTGLPTPYLTSPCFSSATPVLLPAGGPSDRRQTATALLPPGRPVSRGGARCPYDLARHSAAGARQPARPASSRSRPSLPPPRRCALDFVFFTFCAPPPCSPSLVASVPLLTYYYY